MSTLLGLSPFVAGPALGALSAIALGYTRLWHIILGALAGAAVADVVVRVWSNYAATQALRSGRDVAVARATGLGWHTRMLALTILAGFAALIGATVALVRHLLVDGQ